MSIIKNVWLPPNNDNIKFKIKVNNNRMKFVKKKIIEIGMQCGWMGRVKTALVMRISKQNQKTQNNKQTNKTKPP